MAVMLAEPTVLAAAKDTLYPDIDAAPDQYAVTETQSLFCSVAEPEHED